MRKVKTGFLWCLTSLLVISCGKNELTNVEYGNQNKILYVANASEPQSLDVSITTGNPDFHVISALFEGLTSLHPKTLEPMPATAESWAISEDRLTYTFNIRSNAKWSNGEIITASDFVYAWKRALSPALGNQYAYMMFYLVNAEAFASGETEDFSTVGVKAVDSHTLEVKLTNPTPYFLEVLAHHTYYPVHPETIEAHGVIDNPVSKWTLPGNMVSNGPFALKRWEINKVIEVVKEKHYWDAESVKLNGIHFLPIEDKQAEVRAFKSGQIHMTFSPQMAIEKIAFFEKENPDVLHKDPGYSNYFYVLNTTRKPFDDVRVRKALAYAVDRDALVKRVTKGGEVPAFHFVPPDPNGHKPNTYIEYDPALAKKLLTEAGFPNGEGFPSFEILFNTNDNHRKVALAVQQMWKQNLNVNAQLLNQEWKVYLDTQSNLYHDVSRKAWIADYLDPSNFYELMLSYGGNNDSGWKSADYDRLILQAQEETQPSARFALFEQANKILADEMPVIPLYFSTDINLIQPNVRGWYGNVLQRHPYKYVFLESEMK